MMGKAIRRASKGYTLVEMLVVMGIIVLMVSLVALSVGSMLRGSKMNRTVNLFVAAADEARTSGITLRRSVRVDLTRLDTIGSLNRLTIMGPAQNENFENYKLGSTDPVFKKAWFVNPASAVCEIRSDDTRVIYMKTNAEGYYWAPGFRAEAAQNGDYEVMVQGRVKILPGPNRNAIRAAGIIGAVQDNAGVMQACQRMYFGLSPAAGGKNAHSFANRDKSGDTVDQTGALNSIRVDLTGAPSATAAIHEGIWYRLLLSIKKINADLWVAGKVWVDGQLEPNDWTVEPEKLAGAGTTFKAGYCGFFTHNCEAVGDDFLVDMRPIRPLPEGIRIDAMDATSAAPGNPIMASSAAALKQFDFPIIYRPDGTAANSYIVRVRDTSTNDTRYVCIESNTGRTRIVNSWAEATAK
jgi:Tfp pilus assembly protein FimT